MRRHSERIWPVAAISVMLSPLVVWPDAAIGQSAVTPGIIVRPGTPSGPVTPSVQPSGTNPGSSQRAPLFTVLTTQEQALVIKEKNRDEGGQRDPENGAPKDFETTETEELRQAAIQIRSEILRPIPQAWHASARYRAFYPERSREEEKIYESLDRPVGELRFVKTPLPDVVEVIKQLQPACVLDAGAIGTLELHVQEIVITGDFSGVSLRSALRRILGPHDLTHLVKDDQLLFTTKEVAEEHLVVGLYPLPTAGSATDIIEQLHSVVAAETWDIVGGPGAIRPLLQKNELVVATTQEVHDEVLDFMGSYDADLAAEGQKPGAVPIRIYPIQDPNVQAELETKLLGVCRAAMGQSLDPAARVYRIAGKLVVQSSSRALHVYAAEVIRSANGVEATVVGQVPGIGGGMQGMGMGIGGIQGGNPFCWVAREVYGEDNPRWLRFRAWLLTKAPNWMVAAYIRHGEATAGWIRRYPFLKAFLRPLMDVAVEPHMTEDGL